MGTIPDTSAEPQLKLAERIKGFLQALDRQGRSPTPREAHHLLDAISHLDAGQCLFAEQAIAKAEQAAQAPDNSPPVRPPYDPVTVANLSCHLNRIVMNIGQ